MLRKIDVIMPMVASRAHNATYVYGIDTHSDIEHANRLDTKNGNKFWIKEIETEIHTARIAFEIMDEKSQMLIGDKNVIRHLVFGVKIDFTRKARWVSDEYKITLPEALHLERV